MILARACKEPVGRLKDTTASGPIKKGGGSCGKKQFLGTLGTEILLRDRCHGWIRLHMRIVLKALSSFLIIQTSKVLDYFKKYKIVERCCIFIYFETSDVQFVKHY